MSDTYTRDEVAKILAYFEQNSNGVREIFTDAPCKECHEKKGSCQDNAPCWLDELTSEQLAMMWLDRQEKETAKQ